MSVKMTLTAYPKNDFQHRIKEIEPYILMINPEEIKVDRSINYDQSRGQKKYGLYKETSAVTCSFEFIVDGTGIVETPARDVNKSLDHFKQVVYNRVASLSRPPFVEIAYCNLIFRCVLTSLNINYTLFDHNGNPLRAKVSCSFVEVIEQPKKKKQEAPPRKIKTEEPKELPYCQPCPVCNPNTVQDDVYSKDLDMKIVLQNASQTQSENIFIQVLVDMENGDSPITSEFNTLN